MATDDGEARQWVVSVQLRDGTWIDGLPYTIPPPWPPKASVAAVLQQHIEDTLLRAGSLILETVTGGKDGPAQVTVIERDQIQCMTLTWSNLQDALTGSRPRPGVIPAQ